MALLGHSGSHAPQLMHSSVIMVAMDSKPPGFPPALKRLQGTPFGITAGAHRVKIRHAGQPSGQRRRRFRRLYVPLARRASNTFSAVTGRVVTRTPTASCTALATAAAVGMTAVSPMLMLP